YFPLNPATQPADQTAAASTDATQQLPSYCPELEPLFTQSPDLRAAFQCTVKSETTTLVNECDLLATALANKVQTDLNDCLEPCRLSYEQCNACIRGVIAREMEIVNTVDQSCRQKIEDALMFVWHDLVGAMNKIGVPPLTDSDIQTILAGGD